MVDPDCAGVTDVGKVRERNEDHFLIGELNKSMLVHQTSLSVEDHTRLIGKTQGHIYVVADGMGGAAAGERASKVAIRTIMQYVLNLMPWFYRLAIKHEDELIDELKEALHRAESALRTEMMAAPERMGMGTTITLAYVLWPRVYIVHVGDSRCYLVTKKGVQQVTRDHTVAQEMLERQEATEEELKGTRWSHMLLNVVGGPSRQKPGPDVLRAELEGGESLLLCTDGLTGVLSDAQLTEILSEPGDAQAKCKRLIGAANAAGGPDNITVILAAYPLTAVDSAIPIGVVREQSTARANLERKSA